MVKSNRSRDCAKSNLGLSFCRCPCRNIVENLRPSSLAIRAEEVDVEDTGVFCIVDRDTAELPTGIAGFDKGLPSVDVYPRIQQVIDEPGTVFVFWFVFLLALGFQQDITRPFEVLSIRDKGLDIQCLGS